MFLLTYPMLKFLSKKEKMKHFLIKGFYLNLSKRLSVSLTKKKTEAAAAGDM